MTPCADCRPVALPANVEDGVRLARRAYAVGDDPTALEVERRTLGTDYGADGYATPAELDHLAARLGLAAGQRLLDIGTGQGWPGIYLARTTGCSVVLADVPHEGLVTAARRATTEGLGGVASAVAARAQMLPLRPATFDAVIHTDVLCCLGPKLATLAATRRVLRPGGRTAFTVIFPTPGLTAAQARRAVASGPPNCGLRTSYPSLLRSAGFVDIEEHDRTPDYLTLATRKLEVTEELADDLIRLFGRQDHEETQAQRRLSVAAIADGVLRRSLFLARRPPATRRAR